MAKYSKKAGEKVEKVMKEMKQGKLRSGRRVGFRCSRSDRKPEGNPFRSTRPGKNDEGYCRRRKVN